MDVGNRADALATLQRVNYYRLSGYAYPFRTIVNTVREDTFYPGTKLSDVIALYDFDARLRTSVFSMLVPIELAIRALLGHELGRIDKCAHLEPSKLGPTARGPEYLDWLQAFIDERDRSREDFVDHHQAKYGGKLPVWAAVELLGWGALTRLYGFAPRTAQDAVAGACGLTAPQLHSWLKALNLVRNTSAHHGRLFNRVHTMPPKLPRVGVHPHLDEVHTNWSRTFGQLTMIQFLLDQLNVGNLKLLPATLRTFPKVQTVPISHMGAASDWATTMGRLWA